MRDLTDTLIADGRLEADQLRFRFQRLYDMDPPEGMPMAQYMRRFGWNDEQIAKSNAELQQYNAERAFDFAPPTYLHNPQRAHALLCAARDQGGVDMWELIRAVWAANFTQGVDVADPDELRKSVAASGVEVPSEVWDRVSSRDADQLVAADHQRALEIGLDGVPRFYVNGVIVPAWVDVDEVCARLNDALATPAL